MGVMRCDRNGCGIIMCDRYSYEYGYICDRCFEDLLEQLGSGTVEDIKEFMSEPLRVVSKQSIRSELEKIFVDQNAAVE